MSFDPPAGKGTTNVSGLEGYSWARAAKGAATSPSKSKSESESEVRRDRAEGWQCMVGLWAVGLASRELASMRPHCV